MRRRSIVRIFLLLSPAIILAIHQEEIIEVSIPDAGGHVGAPRYSHVLDITNRKAIRLAVQAGNDAYLLFSERHADTIYDNNDLEYIRVILGGWGNTWSCIQLGTMDWEDGQVSTPNILNGSMFSYFWITWHGYVMKVGHGLNTGVNMFMELRYPSTTDIKYLGLWNGCPRGNFGTLVG